MKSGKQKAIVGQCCVRSRILGSYLALIKIASLIGLGMTALVLSAAEFFVTPNGSPLGNGSMEQPWDLQTALSHPTNVFPGDIIWLRGGVYGKSNQPALFRSALTGDPNLPVTVRRFPGERAIINGNISQDIGGSINYWGFEIMNSHSNRLTTESGSFPTAFTFSENGQTNDFCVSGFDLRAPNVQLINVVVHDSIGGGFGVNSEAMNPSLIGVISFYNGWQGCDRSHGHGLYVQNVAPSFVLVQDSLFFANYALGVQATSNEGKVDNFLMVGTTLFFNGVLARRHQSNFLLGPFAGQANNSALIQNFVYDTEGTEADVNIGYYGGVSNPQLYNNYFQTSVYFSPSNQNAVIFGNQFLGGTSLLNESEFPENVFSTNPPQTNLVDVRQNIYESSRAQITVYNWENLPSVAVDLNGILPFESEFEVRSVQDYFGAPVVSGIYTGGVIHLPMTGLRVAKPVGTNAPPSTAPKFNVFIVMPKETPADGSPSNTAPNLSPIGDQSTGQNISTDTISFHISDDETPAEFLTLSVHSSRPDLVPNPNLRFGGSGTNRTLTIVPAPDAFGAAVITSAVSDGYLTVSNVFVVQITNAPASANPVQNETGPVFLTIGEPKVSLTLHGPLETKHEVESSSNLTDWDSLGIIAIDCSGSGLLHDTNASNHSMRYYRVGTNQIHDF